MKSAILLIFLVIPAQVWAWGEPATATTTVEARVTMWTENPCDYGTRFQEACEYARTYNLFPEARLVEPTVGWTSMPAAPSNETTTVEDYGSYITTTTTTNYE